MVSVPLAAELSSSCAPHDLEAAANEIPTGLWVIARQEQSQIIVRCFAFESTLQLGLHYLVVLFVEDCIS